jgi:hypothetical protein
MVGTYGVVGKYLKASNLEAMKCLMPKSSFSGIQNNTLM